MRGPSPPPERRDPAHEHGDHAGREVAVHVEPHGAFSVNSVGLDRIPFPLSFSAREAAGSWMITGAAARAGELADLLVSAADSTIIVADLATNSFLHEDCSAWAPSRIATEQGIDFRSRSLGTLASGVPGLSEEILAVRRDDLPRFLDGWSPYELTLVDIPGEAGPGQLDEIALTIGTAHVGEPVLPGLPGSRVLYSGHDDCYFCVESADPAMPTTLLSRLLALLVGSFLGRGSCTDVPEPARMLMACLLKDSAHWTGTPGSVSETEVTVRLTAVDEPWHLGQKVPDHTDCLAICDIPQGAWRLE